MAGALGGAGLRDLIGSSRERAGAGSGAGRRLRAAGGPAQLLARSFLFPPRRRVKRSESPARPARLHARARTRPDGTGPGQERASCAAPLGRRGPPRASPASSPLLLAAAQPAPHLARTSARPAQARGPREGAARRRSQGSGEAPGRRSMTIGGGLPWVGGCSGACGRCTSSCGRASPARSLRTSRSRVSGPQPGLGGAPGVPPPPTTNPRLPASALRLTGWSRGRSDRQKREPFLLGHRAPRSP